MPLPERKHNPTKLQKIAEQYRSATDWLKFPGQQHLTLGTRRVYRSRINRGDMLPGYEAAMRNHILYIRPRKESDQ